MGYVLALWDAEEEYVYHLAQYLNEYQELPFEVQVYVSKEQLQKYLLMNEIEVALIAESVYEESIKQLSIKHIIVLNESGTSTDGELASIYKYQSCEKIAKQILENLVEYGLLSKSIGRKNQLKIIGLYSPIKRCLQTSFSFILGQMLAKKYKVLYFNFEMYSGLSHVLQKEFEANFSDLIYFLQNGRDKIGYRIGTMVENVNGLDMMPPFLSCMELMSVTQKEWMALFQEIEQECNYEYLILDLSESVQGLFEILRECERIYTITKEDGFAMAKIQQYEELLVQQEYNDILEKTKKHSFPHFRQLPKGIEQLPFCELATVVKEIVEVDFEDL